MQNPLFKLTALASVIGAGMTVVYEAQKHLGQPGGIEQFADLTRAKAAESPATGPTPTAAPATEPTVTAAQGAFPFAQSEPGEPTAAAASEIIARGPSTGVPEPGPDAFSFLYQNTAAGAAPPAAGPPTQLEPLVTAALDASTEPTGTATIQLTGGEQPIGDAAGLRRFPVEAGAPTLLTPPENPPLPPRAGEAVQPLLESAGSELVNADFNRAKNEFAEMVQTVGGTSAEDASSATTDLLAQADPFTVATDRTRDPVVPPPLQNQSEPLDLFGPLPTADTPLPTGTPTPNADVLVLPANPPVTAVSDDPFAPTAIPGTAPGDAGFINDPKPTAPVPPPAERVRTTPPASASPSPPTPALFPELTPTATTPTTASPVPDLFLPQEPTPAPKAANSNSLVLPPGGTADDPFETTPTAATAPTAIAPPPKPGDRIRSAPTPTPAPAIDSPFYSMPPSTAGQPTPTRTAQPSLGNDPFPAFPESGPARGAEPPMVLPEPIPAPSFTPTPSFPQPAPSALPGFPSSNELGGPSTSPFPTRSSLPAAPPANSPLTFPDRNSIPTPPSAPARSSLPDFNTNAAPSRATADPFPRSNDLTGTGTFDSTAPAGLQPELQIEKEAPPKAVLNQPLVYTIRVRNVGRAAAHQVIVEDGIPKGSRLEGTNPEAELDPADKHLIWRIGTLAPAETREIRVKIIPIEAGEIGSVATVRFTGRIAAKTIITAPRVKLEMNGPAETAVGDVPVYRFRVTNSGDGDAANVIVKSSLPEVFEHPSGRELEYSVGALAAGQSRDLELALSAVRAGQASQSFVALVDDREQDRAAADVVVLASRISIERTGPEKRFVNRPANYVTQVTNQSSEPLRNVTVVETLPTGVELAQVPQHGRYDPSRRTVTWVIPQLGPQETQQIHSSLVTADQGAYLSKVQVWDAAGNKAEASSELQVAGFSALRVDMAQTTQGGGEVAIGDQVALRLTVANQGSAAANNVVTEFEIPPELEFVAARPQQYELVNGKVRFPAIPTLDKNGQQVIDIVCVAKQPGRPQIAASIWSKEQESPIRQAEAVVVFREEP